MFVQGPDIEEIPEQLIHTEALVISNIKKTFKAWGKDPVHAVKGINLRIYPNEITAILGHNGAGKTTLFNMLTGMTAPSSGTANICGLVYMFVCLYGHLPGGIPALGILPHIRGWC